ncbi:type II toxin-antitoxin system Phd/YefM family antitoxin [Streptacidiphilus monticola]
MKVMSATELRANLAAALDSVEDDAEELVIHRAGHQPLVVVPLAEYASLRETDYLMRSAAMSERLRSAMGHLGTRTVAATRTLDELDQLAQDGTDAAPEAS